MSAEERLVYHLPSPCGSITVRDDRNSFVPFIVREIGSHTDFVSGSGAVYNTPHRYIIVIPAGSAEKGRVYRIAQEGCRLCIGDTDECSECVAGSGNGFSFALGGTDLNDGEKRRQYTARLTADDPPYTITSECAYDRSGFERYDLHVLPDFSGFRFERLDDSCGEIVFLAAWIETHPGIERETEDAVQFWVL